MSDKLRFHVDIRDGTATMPGEKEVIRSFELTDDGRIKVVVQHVPDVEVWPRIKTKVFERTYTAKDGKIVLEKERKGRVIPPRTAPEQVEWEEG